MASNWNRVVVDMRTERPPAGLLRGLADGEIAVVVLRNLLPDNVFADNLDRVRKLFSEASTTSYANGALTTIGPYLNKYIDDLDGYLAASQESQQLLDSAAFDLDAQVRTGLAQALSLSSLDPARQPDGRRYAASVIRIHADGVRNPLHNDLIMRDAAGTDIVLADLEHQLSCVVCLQECDGGGELLAYQKRWEAADEEFKIPEGLGYDERVVADVAVHSFKPQTRDVYLLNPTRYHAIERVSGDDRLTMGFFLGFADDSLDSAVVWG